MSDLNVMISQGSASTATEPEAKSVELTDNKKEAETIPEALALFPGVLPTEKDTIDSIVSSRRELLKTCHTIVQPDSLEVLSYQQWEARVLKAELAYVTAYGALLAAEEDVEQALAARSTQDAEQRETVKLRSATVEDLRKSFMSDVQGLLGAATRLPYDFLSAAISRAGSSPQAIASKMAAGPSDDAVYGPGQVELDNAQVTALAHHLSTFLQEQEGDTAVRQSRSPKPGQPLDLAGESTEREASAAGNVQGEQ